jgi:hypothetical protein
MAGLGLPSMVSLPITEENTAQRNVGRRPGFIDIPYQLYEKISKITLGAANALFSIISSR